VKQLNLDHRKWEDYRGTRFYNKDCALVIKRWLNSKAYYQAFFRVLIDLIVELLGLIIKPFDNQTES
jgi:hypothetical protein